MTMEYGPTETEDFYTVYCTLYSTVQYSGVQVMSLMTRLSLCQCQPAFDMRRSSASPPVLP